MRNVMACSGNAGLRNGRGRYWSIASSNASIRRSASPAITAATTGLDTDATRNGVSTVTGEGSRRRAKPHPQQFVESLALTVAIASPGIFASRIARSAGSSNRSQKDIAARTLSYPTSESILIPIMRAD
jgi:hypothetical protein